ncbi:MULTISPECIES: hypothetical protein [Brevibacillus]|nr:MULTISPECIES: hypothetical protein [Brevibacillus]MED1944719.1 hypothetical protein [Brevibacillus formosus]MED1996594.1 hypothetical protein [Brevibacillus formosus]MED2081563.1 hypothetical protein [Brevibacillus formosus]
MQMKLLHAEGMGGGNRAAEYLQVDESGRIKLLQKNKTKSSIQERIIISLNIGTASVTGNIDVNIPPQ